MESAISFGELVRRFRKYNDYTQAETAKRLGYSEETIKSWEQGRRFPAREEVARLSDLMELDVLEVKRAIQLERGQTQLHKVFDKNIFNDDRLVFIENELLTRWDVYRTGGSRFAYRGLDLFVNAIENVVQDVQESTEYHRTLTSLSMSYQLMGSIGSDLMAYNQAHASYRKAFKVAEQIQDRELMAAALARRGVTCIQQRKPKTALSFLENAVTLVNDLPVLRLKSYIYKALSEAHAMVHQADESLRHIDLIEQVFEQHGEILERSHCQVNVVSILAQKGVNAVLLGCYQDAIAMIDQSLVTYDHAFIRGRARLIAQKAEAYYGLKQIEACTGLAEEAYHLAEAAGSRKTVERLQQLYALLIRSRWRKETGVARLGALLSIK
ncbi:MAG TPA: helix-turn-helix domain-containing protein [Ktedonobacteraceae bacterium]|nr:helix-turn-helix domain-containing protein [Ktedonobacteraceae bacterium]